MRFAEPAWLLGTGLALFVALFFVLGGVRLLSDVKRFGVPEAVDKLLTARTGGPRALKAALVVLSVALAFVALAGPQYGRGTRLIPATNLDVVIVLDYSKSMYARDVTPNRSERAKAEVARLIQELPGARFGAVAFAGEPLSFPLTSDGGAIAQFFRQLTPNDMPVGGTAIARALESARELLDRDPLSENHQRVMILVTDGEDLEGDPVQVANAVAKQGVIIHVVQIGSRAPEPIPSVDDDGQVVGMRKGNDGKALMTSLSSQGEEQLTQIARAGNGHVIRAESGQTGIEQITRSLKRYMTEELSERVETVYADVFHYPLTLALLLLLVETFVPVARKRRRRLSAATALVSLASLTSGCDALNDRLFTRYSPQVDEAIGALQTHDAGDARQLLTNYLNTGQCKGGEIGTPEVVRERPEAAYDLGLTLFALAQRYGGRLGEPPTDNDPNAAAALARRSQEVDCALRVTRIVAHDESNSVELRAKAFFLSGNLEFLRYDYRNAVTSYDEALRLMPGGMNDAGIDLGADIAFNRAIALRLAQEEEQEEPPTPDAGSPPPPQDGGQQDPSEQDDSTESNEDQQDEQDQDQQDQDQDQDQQEDQDQDQQGKQDEQGEQDQSTPPAPTDQGDEPPPEATDGSQEQQPPTESPSLSQDERILDALERAPMLQPNAPARIRGRAGTLEDK